MMKRMGFDRLRKRTGADEEESLAQWWQRASGPLTVGSLLVATLTLPLVLLLAGVPAPLIATWMPPLLLLAGGLLLPRIQRLVQAGRLHALIAVSVILSLGLFSGMQATRLAGTPAAAPAAPAAAGALTVPAPANASPGQPLLEQSSAVLDSVAGADPRSLQAASPLLLSNLPLALSAPLFAGPATPFLQDLLLPQAAGPLSFKSPPRISRQQFARVLQRGTSLGPSPAAPHAGELYDIVVSYGLDPAVALAFFAHESQYGTDGVTADYNLKNWGALRRPVVRSRSTGIVKPESGGYARYSSWQAGLRDWCELILHRYIGRGLDTVDKAIPVYAPSTDRNNPERYIWAVKQLVGLWQSREGGVQTMSASKPSKPKTGPEAGIYGDDLPSALLNESFHAAGASYRPDWAFHQFAVKEAQAGRPLGSPLGESRTIVVGSKRYAVQAFSNDTLYTPIGEPEGSTNWGDIRRMSDLLKQSGSLPAAPSSP